MTDTPITDAQVEAVARRYCELMGLDPDERTMNNGRLPYEGFVIHEWQLWTWRVRQHIAMASAVREVMGDSTPEPMT